MREHIKGLRVLRRPLYPYTIRDAIRQPGTGVPEGTVDSGVMYSAKA